MTIELRGRVRLNKSASVIEMNAARLILYSIGYSIRRKDDNLELFDTNEKDFKTCKLWADPKDYKDKDMVSTMYVDEGHYSYVLNIDGTIQTSLAYQELVDYREMLSLILRKFQPDTEYPYSSSIGRGRAQREMIEGYHKLLECEEQIEWHD